jgi:hypothetical protein
MQSYAARQQGRPTTPTLPYVEFTSHSRQHSTTPTLPPVETAGTQAEYTGHSTTPEPALLSPEIEVIHTPSTSHSATPALLPAEVVSTQTACFSGSTTPLLPEVYSRPGHCDASSTTPVLQPKRSRSFSPHAGTNHHNSLTPASQAQAAPEVPAICVNDCNNGEEDDYYPSDPEFECEEDAESEPDPDELLEVNRINNCTEVMDDEEDTSDFQINPRAAASSDVDGKLNDELDFDYRGESHPLTAQEQTSFAYHDISVTHSVSRAAMLELRELQPEKPFDYRTTRDRLKALTGVAEVRYDCCIKGCVSYALPEYANLQECPMEKCKHPRYCVSAGGKQQAYAQHSYIPVAHRLRLMYSDKQYAKEMMAYRYGCVQDREKGIRSDFWTGDLFSDLEKNGLFPSITDLAFALSSDGVKVFKTRSTFYIWPIMLAS